jgi:hypothetical protein
MVGNRRECPSTPLSDHLVGWSQPNAAHHCRRLASPVRHVDVHVEEQVVECLVRYTAATLGQSTVTTAVAIRNVTAHRRDRSGARDVPTRQQRNG